MATTPTVIKNLIEVQSNIPDLSITKRKRYIVDSRSAYYALCKKYAKDYSLEKIGKAVKKNHATVLHGLKAAEKYLHTDSFQANKVYDKVDERLKIICREDNDFDLLSCTDIVLVHQHYRIKNIIHSEKYHSVIKNLMDKIQLLENKVQCIKPDMMEEINNLNTDEFKELNYRIELFLKVNKTLKVKK